MKTQIKLNELAFTIIGVLIVYFVPILSSRLSFPLYYFEPMRWVVVLAIVHSTKRNAYTLAVILPLFSYFIASHPSFTKTILLAGDLLLNISLFFYFTKNVSNKFFAMSISIIISKIVYYLLKFSLIQLSIIEGRLISTPLYYQAVMVIIFGCYAYAFDKISADKK